MLALLTLPDCIAAVEHAFRLHAAGRTLGPGVLGVRVKVATVVPGTFPRTDFKARRVVDDRAVFREMHARIEGTAR